MRSYSCRILLVMAAVSTLLPIALAGQQGPNPKQTANPETSHALRISSGDLLDVDVFDTPELSGKLRVSEAGEIALPVAGAIQVSGLTSEEAAVAIEKDLRTSDILHYPHVTVFVSEFATQGVTVTGEVKSPGIFPLLGSHSVVELISAAGGTTAAAGKAVTVTHKSDPDNPEVVRLDSKPGSVAKRVDIRPGDTISVSKAGIVYVLGDVGRPGGFIIETNGRLSVLQAVSLAQGTNRTAALNRAKLIRKLNDTHEDIPVPLKQILAGKSVDLELNDGDVLFIPASGKKVFLYGVASSTVPGVAGAIIYKGF